MTASPSSLPRLDPANECVWRGDERVDLPANAFRVLAYLAGQPNRIVTKDELLDAVWPDAHVIDAVLSVAISQVRQALDDDPKRPRFVETVHRRGYRFIGTVEVPAPAARAVAPEAPAIVGRHDALSRLDLALAAAAQGKRQVVLVTGEPGIGKTTLVDHFLSRAVAADGAVLVARGQCVDTFGAGEPCMPLLEALDSLGRASSDNVERLRAFAPTWLLQLPGLLDPAEAEALRRSLSISTGERMMRELQRALESLAAGRTVVLVLEDLHWSDATTVSMLAALASRREAARLLVVGTYRRTDAIAAQHPIAQLGRELAARRLAGEIALDGLAPASVAEWLRRRYERNRFDTRLAERLHEQTHGNPLFLVNAVEHMQQRGQLQQDDGEWICSMDPAATDDSVPDSTREMIEARIARLADDEQALLEAASVIGGVFAAEALAAACATDVVEVEAACTRLARAGQFLSALPAAEWPDGSASAQYAFGHPLYRQVFFDRVTRARRRMIDLAVGARLEAAYGERAAEIAVPLAIHFERGGDADRAVRWRQAAAGTALRRYAYGPAVEHLVHALGLLLTLPGGEDRDARELELRTEIVASTLWMDGDHGPELDSMTARVLELSAQVPVSASLVRAFNVSVTFLLGGGRIEDGRRFATSIVERLASEWGEAPVTVIARSAIGVCQYLSGELLQAEVNLAPPLELPELGDIVVIEPAHATGTLLADVRCLRGDPRAGFALALSIIRRALPSGKWPGVVYAGANANGMAMLLGARECVEEVTAAMQRIVEDLAAPRWSAWASMGKAWLRADAGEEAAIEDFDRARQTQQRYFGPYQTIYALAQAALLLRFGRYAEAGALATEAWQRMQEMAEGCCAPEALRLRAMALHGAARGGDAAAVREAEEAASSLLSSAMELAARQGASLWELRAAVSLVRLRRGADPADELREVGVPAWRWFDEDVDSPDIREARKMVGEACAGST